MKNLLLLILAIVNQAALAECPRKNITEYSHMTKEELVAVYCAQLNDFYENSQKGSKYFELHQKAVDSGSLALSTQFFNSMIHYNEIADCSTDNLNNAFSVLRKDHGIKTEDEIECDKKTTSTKDK
jgi:hypothetical protein